MRHSKANSTWIWWMIVGAAAVFAIPKLIPQVTENILNGLSIRPVGIKFRFPSLSNLVMLPVDVKFRLTNTNAIGGKLNNIYGTITYGKNGISLAQVTSGFVAIKANGVTDISMTANIDLNKLPAELKQEFSSGIVVKVPHFKGMINTSYGQFDFNEPLVLL